MNAVVRNLALCLMLGALPAAAQDAAPKDAATRESAPAKPAASAAPSAKKISIEFRGNLRDALKAIAQKGGLNLVVTGPLAEDAEVYLKDVTADDALRTVAQAYNLKVQQSGSIWTLRAMTPSELAAAPVPTPPTPPAAPLPAAPEHAAGGHHGVQVNPDTSSGAALPPLPPIPPVPPTPQIKPGMASDAIERTMRETEAQADRAEAEADRLMADADAKLAAIPDDGSEASEKLRDAAEELRDRGEEMKERAAEMKERAAEVRENAREALKSAKQMMHQRVGFNGPVQVKEGEVVEEAVAYGGPLDIQGHVEGDAVSFGGPITLGPKSWVEGDVVSFGGGIERADGAIVEGDVKTVGGSVVGVGVKDIVKDISAAKKEKLAARAPDHDGHSNPLAVFLAWFVVLFGVGFAGSLLAPARMRAIQDDLRRAPLKAGAVGVLGMIALIPLTILLCVTLIGIPVAFLVMWPLAMLGAALGFTIVASEIGVRLPVLRGRKTQAIVLALGLAALLVVGFVPVLGPLALFVLGMAGFGAVLRTRFGARGQTPGGFAGTDIPSAAAVP